MAGSAGSYTVSLVIGIVVVLVVGQLLRRLGHRFLDEVYGDRTLTTSLNTLLGTLYHLFALGLLTLVSAADLGLSGIQLVIARTGIFLLILGAVYGLAVLGLEAARKRRREEDLEDGVRQRGTDRGLPRS
jgi:MFS family permease